MSRQPYPSVGQRVVCIDDAWTARFPTEGLSLPKKTVVYTIEEIWTKNDQVYLALAEIPKYQTISTGQTIDIYHHKSCFRPVAETDISELLALQNPTPHDVGRISRYDLDTDQRFNARPLEKVSR